MLDGTLHTPAVLSLSQSTTADLSQSSDVDYASEPLSQDKTASPARTDGSFASFSSYQPPRPPSNRDVHISPNDVRQFEELVDEICGSQWDHANAEAAADVQQRLQKLSCDTINQTSPGMTWVGGSSATSMQFIFKTLKEKKNRHEALCIVLQRRNLWMRVRAIDRPISDDAEMLAAMIKFYQIYNKANGDWRDRKSVV